MNYKGIIDRTYECLTCLSLFSTHYYVKTTPMYCSRICQNLGKWQKLKQRVEAGEIPWSPTQRKYLTEQRGYTCETCSISEWDGKTLMLQVDHIDGDPGNNFPINLRLLCPNCHSLTPTYKGGNKKTPKMDSRSTANRLAYANRKLTLSN
jgi:hypothetical protein